MIKIIKFSSDGQANADDKAEELANSFLNSDELEYHTSCDSFVTAVRVLYAEKKTNYKDNKIEIHFGEHVMNVLENGRLDKWAPNFCVVNQNFLGRLAKVRMKK